MMENRSLLLHNSMIFGLLLGLFWAVKYLTFMLGCTMPGWGIVYWILTPVTLVLAYVFTKTYKIRLGGRIGFFHAWQFGVLLYFFAALIVSLEHYIFYQYIAPPDFIATSINRVMEMLAQADAGSRWREAMEQVSTPTPIGMAVQGVLNNVFYGVIFSIPVAARLCRNQSTDIIHHHNQGRNNA
ncbi:MAG: DUF4199 domain-containing protein [Tannerellaceae bacterium]|nr:DUF4199 domain-containing protein [Tannerellaceae bacterium]